MCSVRSFVLMRPSTSFVWRFTQTQHLIGASLRRQPSSFKISCRKSRRWYAYISGLIAELKCVSTMPYVIKFSGMMQFVQDIRMVLMTFSGSQHSMKNSTIMKMFSVTLISRFIRSSMHVCDSLIPHAVGLKIFSCFSCKLKIVMNLSFPDTSV